jgi:hypothetical protein
MFRGPVTHAGTTLLNAGLADAPTMRAAVDDIEAEAATEAVRNERANLRVGITAMLDPERDPLFGWNDALNVVLALLEGER